MRRAIEVMQAVAGRLRAYPNVNDVGVAFKEVGGDPTDQVSIRVYVDRKLPRAQLADEDVLPSEVEGVPVDVIQAPSSGA